MSKTQTRRKAAGPRTENSADRLARIADARQLFLDSALNMSWQLAVTIIVPLLIGVSLDNHFHSSPSYTLAALFIAVFMAAMVVSKTVRSVKLNQTRPKQGGRPGAK